MNEPIEEPSATPSASLTIYQQLDTAAKQKLADLVAANMPMTMMADYLQLSLVDMQSLLDEPEIKHLVASKAAEEKINELSNSVSWDSVEKKALKAVLSELDQYPDPDFALRSALAANKAIRKHKQKDATNIAEIISEGTKVVTLQLNQQVVNTLITADARKELIDNAGQKPNANIFGADKKVLDIFSGKEMMKLAGSGKLVGLEQLADKVNQKQFIEAEYSEASTKSSKTMSPSVDFDSLLDNLIDSKGVTNHERN